MSVPRVSVVMPAYNADRYIRQAIESVLGQTESDLELVVVDDGSTDQTAAVVRSAAAADRRVRLVQQPNSGKPAIARNRGIRECGGEIICFLDADDVWRPEKLRTCLAVLDQRPEVNLVFHDVEYMAENGSVTGRLELGSKDFAQRVLALSNGLAEGLYLCDCRALFFFMCTRVTTIYMSAATIRRASLFKEPVFFADDVVVGEDADLWFRIVKTGGIAYVDQALSGYRIHGESVTRRINRNIAEPVLVHLRNYQRSHDWLDPHQRRAYRGRIALDLLGIGYSLSREGRYSEACDAYWRSMRWKWQANAIKGLVKAGGLWLVGRGGKE